jgi:hypothetical protein
LRRKRLGEGVRKHKGEGKKTIGKEVIKSE